MTITLNSGQMAEQSKCLILLDRYGIRPDLKSNSGWARVCNNDKLDLYTSNGLSTTEKEAICKCLVFGVKDRSIEVFKDGKNE